MERHNQVLRQQPRPKWVTGTANLRALHCPVGPSGSDT